MPLIGLRVLSWAVVLLSLAWLFAGTLRPLWEPLARQVPMPAMASEQVSGTIAEPEPPVLALAPTAPSEEQAKGLAEDLSPPVATLPYDQIYPLLVTRDQVAELERLNALVLLRSSLDVPQGNNVVLTIADGGQVHEYRAGAFGQLDLPAREDWLQRDLLVVSNQPPNSLSLSISLVVERLPADQVEYRWLVETADQIELALDTLTGGEASHSRQVLGLTFLFGAGQPGEVRVLSEQHGGEYLADDSGRVQFPFQPELRDENPMVLFSPRPARMTPLTR